LVLSLLSLSMCIVTRPLPAESALDLLSGFDQSRIEAAYPPSDAEKTGELAKLLYRLRKADVVTLNERAASTAAESAVIGDAVAISGRVQSLRTIAVPAKLVEFLEFESFQEVTIESTDERAGRLRVVTSTLSAEVQPDDRVSGIGVVIAVSEEPDVSVVATGRLQWFPQTTKSTGWRLLSAAGVDVSALADVSTRNREPLMTEDADAFYPMLAAAKSIGQSEVERPRSAKPLDLLREPEKYSGDWLTMRVNTVRVTRVSVTEPLRQQQLGSDHYFQIDAMGDLGDVVVQIQRKPGEAGDPIRFENTYPVSLVVASLPEFLAQQIRQQEGGDAAVSMIAVPIRVSGFFFRLWSYESDFMDRLGGGDQFGPLLVVANIVDRQSEQAEAVGVEVIGYLAAAAVISGIVLIAIWARYTSRSDEQERKKRRDREAEELQFPSEI
jgi:hypothetical protein